jgi:hypothetical protein
MKNKYAGVTHNDEYAKQQDIYNEAKKDNNKLIAGRALSKMYLIAKEAAANYIKKYCRSNGLYNLDIEELSHEASVFVIEQYLRKSEFNVGKISAYIHFGVIKVLYKNKDIEMKEVSYDDLLERELNRGQLK